MKFVVAQIGARRGYAVPAILESAGMLERFYTDLTGDVGLGKWLVRFGTMLAPRGRVSRLAGRRLPENIKAKTITFAPPSLRQACRRALSASNPAGAFREHLRWSDDLGHAMARCGFGEATHLYSMMGEGAPLLVDAKRRGIKTVCEIYILLSTERILIEERRRFPEWEPVAPDYNAIRNEFSRDDFLPMHTDLAICPSEAVRDDLDAHFGIPHTRSALVPYGMDPKWLELEPRPQLGRVLFVGTAELRKGIHYLAMAAETLARRGRNYEFRVAGNVTDRVAKQPACKHITFLGRVPRDQIADEFATADVFVLPSLAEGSAEVIYEALGAGVPVITTRAAGSIVRDGIDGLIIPERDPGALAAAIERIVEDRKLRGDMAVGARERARDYTWERYGERLLGALRSAGE